MGRILGILGLLLIFGSIGFLLVSVFATETPLIADTLEAIACSSAEELRIERDRWSLPNGEFGENITYFCDIEPGVGRNVSDLAIVAQIVVFAGVLGLGILLITFAAVRSQRRQTTQWQTQLQEQFDSGSSASFVNVHGDMSKIPPETRDMIENMLGGLITQATMSATNPQSASLAERLQQLDEAYQKNLISKAEYDQVRQAILDSMDD